MARSLLHRYLLRRDLLHRLRVRARIDVVRRLEKDALRDLTFVLGPAPVRRVLDVGAHVGGYTEMFLRAFPEAQVVAFEADPRSQRQLTARFADEPRASLCHRAVSDVDGETVRFHLRPTSATSSLLAPLDEASDTVSAETTTLDAYVAGAGWDRVDLLKVDVEGAEAQVLRGAGGLLRRDGIRAVLCEVRMAAETEGATLLHEVAGLLDQDGYRLHNLYDLVESRARGIIYGNALFLGRGAREDLERRLGPHASTRRLGHG